MVFESILWDISAHWCSQFFSSILNCLFAMNWNPVLRRPYCQLNPTIFIICRWVTAGEPCPKEGETKPNRGNEVWWHGVPFTKPPLLQESRLTGGGSPNIMVLVEWKVPVERFLGAANCFHWIHPWLYTCQGCHSETNSKQDGLRKRHFCVVLT